MSNQENVNKVSYQDMLGQLHEGCKLHQRQIDYHFEQLKYCRGAIESIREAIAQKAQLLNLLEEKEEWLNKTRETLTSQWIGPHTRPVVLPEDWDAKFGVWQYSNGESTKID